MMDISTMVFGILLCNGHDCIGSDDGDDDVDDDDDNVGSYNPPLPS